MIVTVPIFSIVIMPVLGAIDTALPSVTAQVTAPVLCPPEAISKTGAEPNVSGTGSLITKPVWSDFEGSGVVITGGLPVFIGG